MASLYKRQDSKFWWASFLDATGKRRCKSTGLRHDVAADTRRARDLQRQLSEDEEQRGGHEEAWDSWVPQFLEQRYEGSPKSFERYTTAWRNVNAFLREHDISVPRALTRQQVRRYIEWRETPHEGVYKARKNTALLEIKLLGLVMQEAIHNNFAASNPCHKLGLSRAGAVPKPRIKDDEHAAIIKALDQEPEWMQVSYRIAYEQGCRFSETHMHLPTQVDLTRGVVRFRTKGQKDTLAEFPMSPRLRTIFQDILSKGRIWTYDFPAGPSKAWWNFFRRIRMPHLCFHCLRVTFITRCYEANLPREAVMRLVGHSNYAVHQIYPRLTADSATIQAMRSLV